MQTRRDPSRCGYRSDKSSKIKKRVADWCYWGGSGGLIGVGRQCSPSFQFVKLSFKRSAKEERVINRLEVISDVSGFLPCFQVIMFAGSGPLGSLPSY